MSLIQSFKLTGHESYAFLKEVLARLLTQKTSRLHEFLPQHRQHCS